MFSYPCWKAPTEVWRDTWQGSQQGLCIWLIEPLGLLWSVATVPCVVRYKIFDRYLYMTGRAEDTFLSHTHGLLKNSLSRLEATQFYQNFNGVVPTSTAPMPALPVDSRCTLGGLSHKMSSKDRGVGFDHRAGHLALMRP